MIKTVLWMSLVTCPVWASAKTVFESYYRVETDRQHAGYIVQRLTEDPQTKVRTLKAYVQLNQEGKTTWQEFVLAGKAGRAVSSVYKSNESGEVETISAAFIKSTSPKVTVQNQNRKRQTKTIEPVDVVSGLLFFSADLAALKKDVSYSYQAYAEERGRLGRGSIILMNKESVAGKPVLQLADEFLGQTVENFVNMEGIPIGSRMDSLKLVTYWVPDRAAAVGVMDFPEARIKQMFGKVPEGSNSPWAGIPDARADVVIDKFARPAFDRPPQPARSLALPMRKS